MILPFDQSAGRLAGAVCKVGRQHALVLSQQCNRGSQKEDIALAMEVVRDDHPLHRGLAKAGGHDDHGRARKGRCSGFKLVAACFHAPCQPRMEDGGHGT